MKQSELCTQTTRENPKDEYALNAQLLVRAGYVDKVLAGVYAYLPLGATVLHKIEQIVREEMNSVGGQELFLPALHPKENWITTGRWESMDALFKLTSRYDMEYALGATHEEVVVPLIQKFIRSYRDLPISVYQIQTKFRDEPRAKSGLLRGREFRMKDMYSFHASSDSLDEYYDRVIGAYRRIFVRLGLNAILTESSGGTFSKYSHEFQVETPTGEDTIYYCKTCQLAVNKEISEDGACKRCGSVGAAMKASEVGNIFKLGTKYTDPFDTSFMDESGSAVRVIMGCYGIGTSRLMGTIAEVTADERGLRWPESVSPFAIHVIPLSSKDVSADAAVNARANTLYEKLTAAGVSVMIDDRHISAGEKFADSDLLGFPTRVIVSEKTLAQNESVEVKKRTDEHIHLRTISEFLSTVITG